MNYNVVSRPKLPRNKYGEVEKAGGVSGTSYFSGSTESGGTSSDVQIDTFKGSTATEDGIQGLVPAPKCNVNEPLGSLNDNKKFLKGTGAWVDIPISRYTTENVNKDGITLDGDLTVTDTLSTHTLNVTGAAHFWELVIDKVRAAGGNLLITPGNFVVDYVGSDVTYDVDPTESPFTLLFYNSTEGTGILGLRELFENQNVTQLKAKRLYQKNSDGETDIANEIQICDMVRCKTLNYDEDNGFDNKDYWTFVLATGTETYNSESCMYIDVLYQYTSNGSTYGLGTSIEWQDIPPETHLTLHEEDMEIGMDYMCEVGDMFIATSDKSSGNCFVQFGGSSGTDMYCGDLSWDGTKWIVDGTDYGEPTKYIYLNDSFTFNTGGNIGYLECVYDSRWTDPVIKIRLNNINDNTLDGIMNAWGTFYIEDYIAPAGSGSGSGSGGPLLDEFTFGYGTFRPEAGDNLVTLGHLVVDERQNALLISSYDPMDPDLEAPAIAQYEGINQFVSLSSFRTSCIASNGNTFLGKFLVNYEGIYVDIDQKLNLFVTDLNNGLEKVGIHLDGDNSTIKMVGSVEIRQNGDGTVDTLTVWDDDNIMRVRISPDAIPSKSNIQTDINPTTTVNFRTITGQNRPTSGTPAGRHSWRDWGLFTTDHKWEYWLDNAYYDYITYYDIGTFSSGDKISISELKANIRSRAYFKGMDYVSTRSGRDGYGTTHTQSISSVILTLKRLNGSSWATVNTYNLTSPSTITVSDESASISHPSNILNNYTISTSGSYRIELEVVYNVYAYIMYKKKTGESNFYFMFDNSFNSSIKLTQPSAAMTRIGRNGMVFNTDSAGQYFYAGNDGIEIKWGDSSITLDSTNGFKTNVGVTNITSNSSKYISRSASFVNCTSLSSNTTVYLPSVSNYGVGRIITILCNDYVTISTYSNSENIYSPKGNESTIGSSIPVNAFPFSSGRTIVCSEGQWHYGSEEDYYTRTHNPIIKLMCDGTNWYRIK